MPHANYGYVNYGNHQDIVNKPKHLYHGTMNTIRKFHNSAIKGYI